MDLPGQIGFDKAEHFIAGATIMSLAQPIAHLAPAWVPGWARRALPHLAVIAAGVGKELWDRRHPPHDPEVMDALATIAGGETVAAACVGAISLDRHGCAISVVIRLP